MKKLSILAGVISTLALACGDSNDNQGSESMAIEFAAFVGEERFVCGDTYDNLGTNDTSMQLSDFRFYVQDIELKNESGEYVPLGLVESEYCLASSRQSADDGLRIAGHSLQDSCLCRGQFQEFGIQRIQVAAQTVVRLDIGSKELPYRSDVQFVQFSRRVVARFLVTLAPVARHTANEHAKVFTTVSLVPQHLLNNLGAGHFFLYVKNPQTSLW